jgi:hypothetical protein
MKKLPRFDRSRPQLCSHLCKIDSHPARFRHRSSDSAGSTRMRNTLDIRGMFSLCIGILREGDPTSPLVKLPWQLLFLREARRARSSCCTCTDPIFRRVSAKRLLFVISCINLPTLLPPNPPPPPASSIPSVRSGDLACRQDGEHSPLRIRDSQLINRPS